MKVTLTYLGRIISMTPAELGAQFENVCTVKVVKQEQPCAENGWQQKRFVEEKTLFWYDTTPDGVPVFCAFSGYGYRLEYVLKQQGHEVEVKDLVPCGLPERPDLDLFKNIEWRGSQCTVFAKLLANRMGVIDCPTGWGKSFLIRQLARAYPNARICATVPSTAVAKELYDELFMFDPANTGIIGGGKHRLKRRVMVAVTHSLHHIDPETNLVLVDEAHAVLTEGFIEKFGGLRRARFFAFTASPEGRSDQADGFMEAMFGPVLHHVPYQEAVESGNVVQVRYRVYQCADGPATTGIKNKIRRDRQGIWRNPSRNALVVHAAQQAEKEHGEDAQILIMVSTAEHAYILQQALPHYVVVAGELSEEREEQLRGSLAMTDDQIVTTKEMEAEYKEKFSSAEIKHAIATFKWSKGVNFLDLKVLIRADGTASEISSTQVPGRLSRKGSDGQKPEGILVDFNDSFCPTLKQRALSRFKVYRRHGWIYEEGT